MLGYNPLETDFSVPPSHKRTFYLGINGVQFCIRSEHGELGFKLVRGKSLADATEQQLLMTWITQAVGFIRDEVADVQ